MNGFTSQSIEERLNYAEETSIRSQPRAKKKKCKILRKAFHAPIHVLKIGTYTVEAKYAIDLVAKFLFNRNRLAFEILDANSRLKSKIEIHCNTILGIQVITEHNEPGILRIELGEVPQFYREPSLSPAQTKWARSSDFTPGMQASRCRRYYLQFHPGVLGTSYQTLLSNNEKLMELSKRPFPTLRSPYFNLPYPIRHVQYVHGSKIILVNKQQQLVPTEQVQYGNAIMPLPPTANNNPISQTSGRGYFTNEAIKNQNPQHKSLNVRSQQRRYVADSAHTRLFIDCHCRRHLEQPPVVPNEKVQQLGNVMMPYLPLPSNGQISAAASLASESQPIIEQPDEQAPLFSNDMPFVPNSGSLETPVVPTKQAQLSGMAMPLPPIASNHPIPPNSNFMIDTYYPKNDAIGNQMFQLPEFAAWNQGPGHETLFSTELAPRKRKLQQSGPAVSDYKLPSNINGVLATGYNNNNNIPETVFNTIHVGSCSAAAAAGGSSREAAFAYNTNNTSTQTYQPCNTNGMLATGYNDNIPGPVFSTSHVGNSAAAGGPSRKAAFAYNTNNTSTQTYQPCNTNGMLATGYSDNIPGTVFNTSHVGSSSAAAASPSREAATASNTNSTSTQTYQPNNTDSEGSCISFLDGWEELNNASDANLNHMFGNTFDDQHSIPTQNNSSYMPPWSS
ncbi:hypothetical protein RIF29_22151 [Crotalaria pallida]|uniref:TRF2/HOY1 PH-like domain-containing protein n=1 Tax=Crotalaria pallida TaxID=3830 RepID=A0AAN9IA50_CROPI